MSLTTLPDDSFSFLPSPQVASEPGRPPNECITTATSLPASVCEVMALRMIEMSSVHVFSGKSFSSLVQDNSRQSTV
jgi:hypothetical protein